jgi:hypothetical protein
MPFLVEYPALDASSIICKIYKAPPFCIAASGAMIYYYFGKDFMTCSYIHLGVYEHVVKDGKYQDFKEKSCILVREQV